MTRARLHPSKPLEPVGFYFMTADEFVNAPIEEQVKQLHASWSLTAEVWRQPELRQCCNVFLLATIVFFPLCASAFWCVRSAW